MRKYGDRNVVFISFSAIFILTTDFELLYAVSFLFDFMKLSLLYYSFLLAIYAIGERCFYLIRLTRNLP